MTDSWFYVRGTAYDGAQAPFAPVKDGAGSLIAKVSDRLETGPIPNARLIAAAPDLLAAVRAILFQVNQGKVLERDSCIEQARAAWIKAGGIE